MGCNEGKSTRVLANEDLAIDLTGVADRNIKGFVGVNNSGGKVDRGADRQ